MEEEIKKLVEERERLRQEKKFDDADRIREKLKSLGYSVEDLRHGSAVQINKKENSSPAKTFLTLFGSGETSSVGRKIHENVFSQMNCSIKIAIVTSPAGFQPNVKTVHEEIADFFENSLFNFKPEIEIVYANTNSDTNNTELVSKLDKANYIFMGPGSPTYALHVLRDSLLLKKLKEKISDKSASLSLSSAAVLAFSKWCLPVYEIYKVGADLYWEKGLDLYSDFFDSVSFIPHFNNTEGGEKTDTTRCYMGLQRFDKMLKIFPGDKLFGIDEQTAVVFDLGKKERTVMGKGKLHENL